MKKELIKQRFSRSLKTYQTDAIVQKQMAEKLVSLLNKTEFNNILELGCGTGFLTELLNSKTTFNSYTAIDIVKECEPYINKINPSINFLNKDIEEFEIQDKYDLIISNAVFQWLTDFESFIHKLKNNLTENGIIVFTTFGQKNFEEISKISDISLNYLSLNDIKTMLKDFKIEVLEEIILTQEFKTVKAMLEHMKKTGVNALSETTWGIKELNNFKKEYLKEYETIHLTYNPIYVVLST